MIVSQTREAPELIGKALHRWDDTVSYQTLTYEEIIRSVQRADIVNHLEGRRIFLQAIISKKT